MKVSIPPWGEDAYKAHHEQGDKVKDLAKKYGVTASRVYQVFQVMRGDMSRVPWAAEAKRLLDQGKTREEIAKMIGKSRFRVNQVLRVVTNAPDITYATKTKKSPLVLNEPERKPPASQRSDPMPDRVFLPVKAYRDPKTGIIKNGVMIRCGKDDCGETSMFLKAHGPVSHQHAAQIFRNRGWVIGGGPRGDRCPECSKKVGTYTAPSDKAHPIDQKHDARAQAEAVFKQQEAVSPAMNTGTPHGEAMKPPLEEEQAVVEMSRDDQRVIFAKLNDVYADENTGYRRDWTDAKVAQDMGVPVGWVSKVRGAFFGPERNMQEVARQIAALREKAKQIDELAESVHGAVKASERAREEVANNMVEFEKKFEEFRTLYNSIK